jgi:pimeloyl-ACP methyl ester carboxylesterase
MGTLAMARVVAPGVTPARWLVFLHGILGSGANWRSFARQVVTARPAWGALLVDLRLHGESRDFSPPHTVEAAADDVVRALAAEGLLDSARGALGHSFGGKVALALARQLGAAERPLEQLFVIDSTPGARPDGRGSSGVRHIVELLTELPSEFADRNAFTAWIEARGVSRPTAMWLAMNVRPEPGTTRFVFRIDIEQVRAMMNDYFLTDFWPVVERPEPGRHTHLVTGEKSEVVDAPDRARAAACPRTTVDVVAGAGHWVHVDAPDRLLEIVLGYLADVPGAMLPAR